MTAQLLLSEAGLAVVGHFVEFEFDGDQFAAKIAYGRAGNLELDGFGVADGAAREGGVEVGSFLGGAVFYGGRFLVPFADDAQVGGNGVFSDAPPALRDDGRELIPSGAVVH